MKEKFETKKKIYLISLVVVLIVGATLIVCGVVRNYSKPQKTNDNEDISSGEINSKEDIPQLNEPEKLGFRSDSGNSEDINEEIKDELNIDKLKLSNFQLTKADQSVIIAGEIENTSSKAVKNIELKFILYRTSDEGIYEYSMEIPETLEVNEKRKIETCIGYRYEDIESLDVELEKIEFAK